MIPLVIVELFLAVVATAAFLLLYGPPGRHRDPVMAWHVAAFTFAHGLELSGVLLLTVGMPLPAWAYAGIFGLGDAVVLQRLYLLVRVRRRELRNSPNRRINEDQPGG